MNQRQIFLQHIAPTSDAPLALNITRAEKARLYDDETGKVYIDLLGGISVCNVGHCHPKVVAAIQQQAAQYLHVMVYGEVIQSPQVAYASFLVDHLPETLNSVYFVNSGAEAVEGAMKLAKKHTGKPNIIAFHQSYHGSTQGALSILGDESFRQNFRPLLPGISHEWYNNYDAVAAINSETACVIMEPIQAEAGIVLPDVAWLKAIREKCNQTGTLLIFDEIQTGFGRTGKLFAFEHWGVIPDVLLIAKAMGGGMPLGAFVSDIEMMKTFTHNPVLGHITTFGGHPVCCAAGLAAANALYDEHIIDNVPDKEALFKKLLIHPLIKEVRSKGLMMGIHFENHAVVAHVMKECMMSPTAESENQYSIFTTWFLFADDVLGLLPPLVISEEDIQIACSLILKGLDGFQRDN